MRLNKFFIILVSLIILVSFSVSALPICEIDLIVKDDDTVEFIKGISYEGLLKEDQFKSSIHKFKLIREGKQNVLGMPVVFFIPHTGPSNSSMVSIPYLCEKWDELLALKYDQEIFKKDISNEFCNENGVCELNETAVSCSDCPPSGKDGWCNRKIDNICDPDCLYGDFDCFPEPVITKAGEDIAEQCNKNGICEIYENEINCPSDCEKEIKEEPVKIVKEEPKRNLSRLIAKNYCNNHFYSSFSGNHILFQKKKIFSLSNLSA